MRLDVYPEIVFEKNRNKILVLGESSVNLNTICNLFKEYGVARNCIEVINDFNKIKRIGMEQLKKYKLILVGPTPHSCKSKEYNTSMFTNLFQYSRVEKLMSNGKFKITKSNLNDLLSRLNEEQYLNFFKSMNWYLEILKYEKCYLKLFLL